MTAHAHRAPFRPFDRQVRRRGTRTAPTSAARVDHAPEVLLALSAVLVVLAGPVARTFAPDSTWVAVASTLLLAAGIALAALAARDLLRPPGA